MQEIQILIKDTYSRNTKNGSYIAHLMIKNELYKVVKREVECCESRVNLIVSAIEECVNLVDEPSYFSIITLTNWGASLIRNDDGSWKHGRDKKIQNSVHKDILLDLQQLMRSKGHKISSFLTSRNMILEKVVSDDDMSKDTYMSFKIKKDTKRKFEELCYNKGVDEEKVLNRLLESFLKRNMG